MVDVFVSYSREDLNRVQPIVSAIIDRGWDVWWDRDLSAGPRFDESIEQALDNAKLVIVLWSRKSVTSDWVKTEANEALCKKCHNSNSPNFKGFDFAKYSAKIAHPNPANE